MSINEIVKAKLKSFKEDKYLFLITLISAIFAALFMSYSFLNFNLVNMSAWDLGIYTQALHSGITGHLFYSNLIPGSYLSEHFSPILFIMLIPYYIYPHAYTLLFLQDLAIGMSAIALFILARTILTGTKFNGKYINKDSLPFIISIAYIMSPLTESPVFFDFHLMVFLPLFFFLALYFFINKKFWLNILFLALIISLHSEFIFIVFMVIIMELFLNRTLKIKNERPYNYIILFSASFIVLFSYYIIAGFLKGDISGNISAIPHVHVTGSVGPVSLLLDLFYKPLYVFNLLTAYYFEKLIILFFVFAGFSFLVFRYPPAILTFIPYLVYSMFSTYQSYYTIGYQYPMMIIPMAAFAAVMGFYIMDKKNYKIKSFRKKISIAVIAIIIIALLGLSIASPLTSGYIFNNGLPTTIMEYGNSTNMNKIDFEHEIARNIGDNARVVTDNNLFSLFGNDPNATAFPFTSAVVLNGCYYTYLVDEINSSWSIENAHIGHNSTSLNDMEERYYNSGNYGILVNNFGIIVLEKDYHGPVMFN